MIISYIMILKTMSEKEDKIGLTNKEQNVFNKLLEWFNVDRRMADGE